MVADVAEVSARRAALELLAAAEAVVDVDSFRSPGREVQVLADAALMYAMAATTARWARPVGDRVSLVVLHGGVSR